MRWLQLDPVSVARRAEARGVALQTPRLGPFVVRGALGFLLVSLAGFAPWTLAGSWFYQRIGEAGLYAVCALVFIAASGPLLHRLILGPGSLPRFYALFGVAFAGYSVAWTAAWLLLPSHTGSVIGLAAGTAFMGWVIARAFAAASATLPVVLALFLFNAAGYFLGGVLDAALWNLDPFPFSRNTQLVLARSSWAVLYGLGFGAGLGYAFYRVQRPRP